jgi:hypothetical protein
MVIKQVGALSCARIAGTLYAILGLFIGAIISLLGIAGAFGAQNIEGGAGLAGAFMGIGAVIMAPIIYGCFGFVSALIGAWLYNLLAGIVGGIEIEVQ